MNRINFSDASYCVITYYLQVHQATLKRPRTKTIEFYMYHDCFDLNVQGAIQSTISLLSWIRSFMTLASLYMPQRHQQPHLLFLIPPTGLSNSDYFIIPFCFPSNTQSTRGFECISANRYQLFARLTFVMVFLTSSRRLA